jgi:hypothetical protein
MKTKYRCPYCVDMKIENCAHAGKPLGINGKPLPPPSSYAEYGNTPEPTTEERPNPLPVPEIDMSVMKEMTTDGGEIPYPYNEYE